MESLTPFIRHELEDAPGPSGPPEETSSVVSPPVEGSSRPGGSLLLWALSAQSLFHTPRPRWPRGFLCILHKKKKGISFF